MRQAAIHPMHMTIYGTMIFIAVPAALWLLGAFANRGHGLAARLLGFTVGTDNRLSLSRLQAFFWTLVIFGSYAAAMAIHADIRPATDAEISAATQRAQAAVDEAAVRKTDYQKAQTAQEVAESALDTAEDTLATAQQDVTFWAKVVPPAATKEEIENQSKMAQAALLQAQKARDDASALKVRKTSFVTAAKNSYDEAQRYADNAQNGVPSSAWVQIPSALLALSGIAIGTGVFSSLIAAVGGEDQTASVTGLRTVQFGTGQNQTPLPASSDVQVQAPDPNNPNSIVLSGAGFGTSKGSVRFRGIGFNKTAARVIYWRDSEIALDVPDKAQYSRIIVDTPNGKLTYKLSGAHPNFTLGNEVVHYEFVDLFRDDKNPNTLSLMKFQMFGWTLIAITIYVWLFLTHLSDHIQTLPLVDPSVAILTGVSQAGYLAGKGVSNTSSQP